MKKILLFAAVATMFAACSKDATEDINIASVPDKLHVSIADDDSRVQLDENCRTVWTEGDLVAVYNSVDKYNYNNYYGCYKFDGRTGDSKGTLSYVSSKSGSLPANTIFAVYPYSASNGNYYGTWKILPASTQYYKKDSFGIGANLMIAKSNNVEELRFYNLLGYIKLQLLGNGVVTSIVLTGNNNEIVSGNLEIRSVETVSSNYKMASLIDNNDMKFYVQYYKYTDTGTQHKSVTLSTDNGVELSDTEPTSFYIGVIPQEFANGITITINFNDGSQMTKSTSNEISVSRNHIRPLSPIFCQSQKIPNNEIWYTSANNSIIKPKASDFGANIISNTYSNGKGIIKFDGDVTMVGANAFNYNSNYSCYITSITLPSTVTDIGENAFAYCDHLSSIHLSQALTYIGKSAFSQCSALSYIDIPSGVKKLNDGVFLNCSSLTAITLPSKLISIGSYAFSGCNKLTEINIPNTVITIGEDAFKNCSDLKKITLPGNLSSLGNYAFYNCTSLTSINLPNSITDIGEKILYGCINLSQITGKFASSDNRCLIINGELEAFARAGIVSYAIPNNATIISGNAFQGCKDLQSITIHNNVTRIYSYSFSDCTGLKTIVLGKGLELIYDYAFSGCSSLRTLNIPEGVTYIGTNAFSGCSSLTTTTIPKSVTSFGKTPFAGCTGKITCNCNLTGNATYEGDAAFANSKFTEFVIGDDVTEVTGLFAIYIDSMTDLTIGKNVATIKAGSISSESLKSISGKYASSDHRCLIINNELILFAPYGLSSYSIPSGVKKIGSYTFHYNKTLRSITIPASVTSIGTQAFDSTFIEELYCKPTTPPSIDYYSLRNSDCIIYVPRSSVNKYKANSYWSNQTIIGYDF